MGIPIIGSIYVFNICVIFFGSISLNQPTRKLVCYFPWYSLLLPAKGSGIQQKCWLGKSTLNLGKLLLSVLQFFTVYRKECWEGNLPLKKVLLKSLKREYSSTIAWNTASITIISGCQSATNLPPTKKRRKVPLEENWLTKCYTRPKFHLLHPTSNKFTFISWY